MEEDSSLCGPSVKAGADVRSDALSAPTEIVDNC